MRYTLLTIKGHEVQVRPDGYWWRATGLDQYVMIGEIRRHATEFLSDKKRQQAKLRADKIKQQQQRELAQRQEAKAQAAKIPRRAYYWATSRAKRQGVNIMTPDQYSELWRRAAGHCEVSGIPFSDERQAGCLRKPWAASIDRIDSNKDYHASNCRLVCGIVNVAMGEYGDSVLIELARALVRKHGA